MTYIVTLMRLKTIPSINYALAKIGNIVAKYFFYYIVESKILKIYSKIFNFHIFTNEDIDHVIISRQ